MYSMRYECSTFYSQSRFNLFYSDRFSEPSHTDLMDTDHMPETHETSLLGESLQTVLSKRCGQKAFREFLKSEYCEENLDFWLACQEFQMFYIPEDHATIAALIYNEFIRDDSPKQVNLDFYTRDEIKQSLHQPGPSCFVVAQKKIYSLMENDSFTRFTRSKQYQVFIDATIKQKGLKKHRMALRKKGNMEDIEDTEDTLQSGLPLSHKD